ncbi:MAG: WG repeat-containing protein [Spirochaetes bacterium]|nr:WG repeat-containing protein [Spirochaetota bacterium]
MNTEKDILLKKLIYICQNGDQANNYIQLVNKIGNVDIAYNKGNTPLHIASYNNRIDMVHVLLMHGANPHRKNNNGESPIDIANKKKHTVFSSRIQNFLYIVKHENEIPFPENTAVIMNTGKFGYINSDLDIIIECIYDDARQFSQGLAGVKKNSKWGFIDIKGEIKLKFNFDVIIEDFRSNRSKVQINDKKHYINRNGEIITVKEEDPHFKYIPVDFRY